MTEQNYIAVRQAWIDGVTEYYPGQPKESYVLPWEKMADWERQAVKKLYHSVRDIISSPLKNGVNIPDEQGGYLVCSIWNIVVYDLLKEPKESYVKPFDRLDTWQRKTDIKMFRAIEGSTRQELDQAHT